NNARIERRLIFRLVEEHAGDVLGAAPVAAARVEPHLVLLDRPAAPAANVPDLLNRAAHGQAARFQIVADIAAGLEGRVGPFGHKRPTEPVAAVLRHPIHILAAAFGLLRANSVLTTVLLHHHLFALDPRRASRVDAGAN